VVFLFLVEMPFSRHAARIFPVLFPALSHWVGDDPDTLGQQTLTPLFPTPPHLISERFLLNPRQLLT